MKRPKKTKKARKMANKSGIMPCEICNEPNILETHHIEGRDIPNCDHPANLCSICPNCHSRIHWGHIIVEKWIMTTSGMELFWHKKGEETFTGSNSMPHIISSKL